MTLKWKKPESFREMFSGEISDFVERVHAYEVEFESYIFCKSFCVAHQRKDQKWSRNSDLQRISGAIEVITHRGGDVGLELSNTSYLLDFTSWMKLFNAIHTLHYCLSSSAVDDLYVMALDVGVRDLVTCAFLAHDDQTRGIAFEWFSVLYRVLSRDHLRKNGVLKEYDRKDLLQRLVPVSQYLKDDGVLLGISLILWEEDLSRIAFIDKHKNW